ncbi:Crp/Fnr family transcriptional regulator [Streptomyces sp. TR06-5]|uniref:Crp/Fnr family transcriptional regulator n=1 Tax=unclassified Streptomyces TaxID=2593676 RepID=UPI0039A2185D
MTLTLHLLDELSTGGRARLLEHGHGVRFAQGTRIFHEGHRADRFWVLESGAVRLDLTVPTRPPLLVETLHSGDLLGWSWFFPPYEWHLGAQADGPVSALEFDAAEVRRQCAADTDLGYELAWYVARIIGHRLQRTRFRLLDIYGPNGLAPESEDV